MRAAALACAVAALVAARAPAAPLWQLDLGTGAPAPGFTTVPLSQPYHSGGVGFEPDPTASAFLLSAAVPEGLYRVTVVLGDPRRAGRTTVKAEARRLMLLDVATRRGETVTRSFLVAVRTPTLPAPPLNAPGGDHVRLKGAEAASFDWDDRLTLEFLGQPRVRRVSIEPAATTVPTLYLAGDSTVTDQPKEPWASWGQMLPAFLDGQIAVANHAWSGETLKSFLTELRLDKLLSQAKEGDWLLIQFGHNDQKPAWPQTYVDPVTTYPAYLRAYIAEARRRRIMPILVTPPERRNFGPDGHIVGTLDDYAEAMRRVSRQENVPLIDLNRDSRAIYEALGPQTSPKAFAANGMDKTHNDNYGAWLLARLVAQGLARIEPVLGRHVDPGAIAFDPSHPPQPGAVDIPESVAHDPTVPAGN